MSITRPNLLTIFYPRQRISCYWLFHVCTNQHVIVILTFSQDLLNKSNHKGNLSLQNTYILDPVKEYTYQFVIVIFIIGQLLWYFETVKLKKHVSPWLLLVCLRVDLNSLHLKRQAWQDRRMGRLWMVSVSHRRPCHRVRGILYRQLPHLFSV